GSCPGVRSRGRRTRAPRPLLAGGPRGEHPRGGRGRSESTPRPATLARGDVADQGSSTAVDYLHQTCVFLPLTWWGTAASACRRPLQILVMFRHGVGDGFEHVSLRFARGGQLVQRVAFAVVGGFDEPGADEPVFDLVEA